MGKDGPALGSLAAEIAAADAALERFQRFVELIDGAHQAETDPRVNPTLLANATYESTGTLNPPNTAARRAAAAIPLLFEALGHFEILERDDWQSSLNGRLMGNQQV